MLFLTTHLVRFPPQVLSLSAAHLGEEGVEVGGFLLAAAPVLHPECGNKILYLPFSRRPHRKRWSEWKTQPTLRERLEIQSERSTRQSHWPGRRSSFWERGGEKGEFHFSYFNFIRKMYAENLILQEYCVCINLQRNCSYFLKFCYLSISVHQIS